MLKYTVLILVLLGFLVYGNALRNGFVWDDEEQILNNSLVHSVSNIPRLFTTSTFNAGGTGALTGVYYRPAMMVVFSVLYQLFGPVPTAFHGFQILLFIGISILLFLVLRRMMSPNVALIISLFYLVHPGNVESVAYISATQDSLFIFFSLLALFLLQQEKKASLGSAWWVVAALFMALLSKEVAVVTFVLVFVYRAIFFRTTPRYFIILSVFFLLLYALLRFGLAGVFFTPYSFAPIVQLSITQRLFMIPALILFYLTLTIFPWRLAVMQHWVIKDVTVSTVGLPFVVVGAFFVLCLRHIIQKRDKTFTFFFLWFVAALSPYLQIFPLDMTVAERWFSFPLIGLLGMGGSLVMRSGQKLRQLGVPGGKDVSHATRYKMYFLACFVVIFCFGLRTVLRTFDWKNGLTLYGHDITISHSAFDLENNYGVELFRVRKYDEAAIHFQNSITLAPTWWTNYNNLGAYYEHQGDLVRAEGLYKKSIDNGQYYLAYENYGFILIKEKKYTDAVTFLEKSTRLLPQNERLLVALTIAYYETGQHDKALTVARYVLSLSDTPDHELLYQTIVGNKPIKM